MAIINNLDSSEIKKLCDPCIESKYIKIVRYKKMTPTGKLQEIHADLWESYDPLLLSRKPSVSLLFDKFKQKSWILLLKSKYEFFDAFKLWFLRDEEASREKFGYLQTDSGGEFISTALKDFCKERSIIIAYTTSYIHKENGMTEQC